MKKVTILITCFLLSFSTLNAQEKKVALTSFWVSKHIGFDEIGGGVGLATSIASLSEDPNFNLKPVLDNFYKVFTEEYSKQFPFALLNEDDVLNNKSYKNYEGSFNEEDDKNKKKIFQRFLCPKTYKPLQESLFNNEKSNQMQMVQMFKEVADGVMFVSMSYDFVKKPMPFTAGIRAYIRIKIWNKEGDKVLTINDYATSKESVTMIAGIPLMEPKDLLPLCENASAKLVTDLNKKLKKIAIKCAKKL
jgi:hypothetical protein